jgi:YD repeat-containing protein
LPNGAYVSYTYDELARLTSVALRNSGNSILDSHGYVVNAAHQRTQQTFKDGNYVDYTYDDLGQLLTAKGKEAGGTTRLQEQFSYGYDAAWNLNKRTNNALVQAFNVNNLNALTTATNSGTLTVAGNTTATASSVTVNNQAATLYTDNTFAKVGFTVTNGNNAYTAIAQDSLSRKDTNSITFSLSTSNSFTYDSNGNLTSDGTRGLEYDDENQLTRVTVTNKWKSEFSYDGMLRRRIRKEYTWSGSWVKTNEVRYLYDARLVVQERDANNLATVSYTRGNDLSGSLESAGGIGGRL